MSDQKILDLFKTGQRDRAFIKLYKLYPRIESLILSKGGRKQDAKDVFQEALIILYRRLKSSDFKLTASLYTYLYSVARFVWSDLQKSNSKEVNQTFSAPEQEINESVINERKYRIAEKAFQDLGGRCKQLLQLFYLKKMSFKDIAKTMNFSSDRVAKNQKYKCLLKARQYFKETFNQMHN